jgi:two-component system sporulation sensor kinase A
MDNILIELIKNSEAKSLLYLLDTLPSAVLMIKSPDGSVGYMNNRAKNIFGITLSEEVEVLKRTTKFTVLLPNGKICPNEKLPLVRALFQGETIRNEEFTIKFDGKTILTSINAVPLFDETKKTIAAVGVFEDITYRRNLNEKLRESLDLYSNLVLASPNTIILQSEGKIIYINPEGAKLFGTIDEAQIIGKPLLDFVAPEFHEITKQRMAQARVEQVPLVERTLVRLNGTTFHALVTSRRLTYKGKPATQIIVQDIDKLKASEKRYSDLFNSVAEGIILFDAVYDRKGAITDLRCVNINTAYEHVLERGREEIIGKNLSEFIAKEDLPRMDMYKQVVIDCTPYHYETYMLRVKKHFDVYTYCPAPKQLAIMFRDITERKKLEEVLQRDKETLEKLVIERSHELIEAHADLERAKRLSDIGTLAATVAHELRNPLVAVNISTGLIRKKSSDPSIKKPLDNIEKSLAESEQIINNLLLYSKISPPHLTKVDLYDLFEECIGCSPCRSKKNFVKTKLENLKNLSIKVDPTQMKEVIHNLINNACEALENKKGQIEMWAVEDKESVKIFVKDNGTGIKKEHLDEVFSPFFTTKPKGTGLGLAVCYQIIHAHGGTIDIESTVRKGTTVAITLPKK